jgi:hypothetical protein
VGSSIDASNVRHSFVLYPDGAIRAINVPEASQTLASGINDHGDVAGVYYGPGVVNGFLWVP